MLVINLRSEWLINQLDSLFQTTGKETFEHVSFACRLGVQFTNSGKLAPMHKYNTQLRNIIFQITLFKKKRIKI